MGRGGRKPHKHKLNKGQVLKVNNNKEPQKKPGCTDVVDGCFHVTKAVRLQSLQSNIPHVKIGQCKVCGKGPSGSKDNIKGSEIAIKDVCICLRCGHQACSRQCKQQHAYQHYMTTPSHCVTFNIRSWIIWCYECDKELTLTSESSHLSKCLVYIKSRLPADIQNDLLEDSKIKDTEQNTTSHQILPTQAKGLKNLGNTCFFNSVVQNLAQTRILKFAMKNCMKETRECTLTSSQDEQPPLTVNVNAGPGMITQALKDLLTDFSKSGQKILSPGRLFGEISKRAPQFRGFQQHDSQELLRYLLDGMKTEELKRIETAITESIQEKGHAEGSTKEAVKGYLKTAKTFVDDIFGGVLVSTVRCHDCKNISRSHDGFLDLSLPASYFEKTRNLKNQRKSKEAGENNIKDTEANVNQSESQEKKEKRMTKHQKKVLARQERKARRGKDRKASQAQSDNVCVQGGTSACTENKESPVIQGSLLEKDSNVSKDENPPVSTDQVVPNPSSELFVVEDDQCLYASEKPKKEYVEDKETPEDVGDTGSDGFETGIGEENSDEEEMNVVDQERLSAMALNVFSEMMRTCSFDSYPGVPELTEEEEEGDSMKDSEEDRQKNAVELLNRGSQPEAFALNDAAGSEILKIASDCLANLKADDQNISADLLTSSAGLTRKQDATMRTVGISSNVDSCSVCDEEAKEIECAEPVLVGKSSIPGCETLTPNRPEETSDCEMSSACNQNWTNNSSVSNNDKDCKREITASHTHTEATHSDNNVLADHVTDTLDINDESEEDKKEALESDKLSKIKLKDEWDSGFSSGEIFSNSTASNEDDTSDIENLGDLEVPEGSILECLKQFCRLEKLDGRNKFACEHCCKRIRHGDDTKEENSSNVVLTEATKQFMISKPPKILTLHLKRFEQTGRQLRKINRNVDFPLLLDIGPFCHHKSQVPDTETKYKLYGLVEHSGSLHGGHYVAYVHGQDDTKWYHVSDTRVSVVSEEVVLRRQAYLLFYEQLETSNQREDSTEGSIQENASTFSCENNVP